MSSSSQQPARRLRLRIVRTVSRCLHFAQTPQVQLGVVLAQASRTTSRWMHRGHSPHVQTRKRDICSMGQPHWYIVISHPRVRSPIRTGNVAVSAPQFGRYLHTARLDYREGVRPENPLDHAHARDDVRPSDAIDSNHIACPKPVPVGRPDLQRVQALNPHVTPPRNMRCSRLEAFCPGGSVGEVSRGRLAMAEHGQHRNGYARCEKRGPNPLPGLHGVPHTN